jgi:hypothetical protein
MTETTPPETPQTEKTPTARYMAHQQVTAAPERGRIPPDHIGVLIAAGVMAVAGWWGVYALITQTIPRVGQRWMFFMFVQLAVTGTALPLVRYLNVRFTPVDKPLPPGGVLVRQSTWVGLFAITCAWLQIPRVLNWSIAFFMAIIFVVLEAFLRSRERQLEEELAADER